ncbi:MAG: RDD family protein [Proteobacteria bacterium]|nr:MAG: RDD family protein [Pseudomonadota bacterium]
MSRPLMHKPGNAIRKGQSSVAGQITELPYREVKGYKLFHDLNEDFSVYQPADYKDRVFAFITDAFFLGVVIAVLKIPFLRILDQAGLSGNIVRTSSISLLVNVLAFNLCHIMPLMIWGQTLGKYLLGIRIVTVAGYTRLSPISVITREIIGKSASLLLLGIGFLLPIWRADRRSLHDLAARSIVVKVKS